jgi:hypothetical protein
VVHSRFILHRSAAGHRRLCFGGARGGAARILGGSSREPPAAPGRAPRRERLSLERIEGLFR